MDLAPEKLRINPGKSEFYNLAEVTTNGDWEVTFHLKRPQPAFPMVIAADFSGIYPCHVSPGQMLSHPIGTGPFKFVEYKPNEFIKVTRNPHYWKSDRPYLDCIEYTIIKDPATATLAFTAGKFDITFPYVGLTIPQMKNIESQMPQAICELNAGEGINRHILVNYYKPPFDDPAIRRALALNLDRRAFIDTISKARAKSAAFCSPRRRGCGASRAIRSPRCRVTVPTSRRTAAEYGEARLRPRHRLAIKVSARNLQGFRDPAVLLIDQIKRVYIDGELELIDTPQYYPKILRKDFTVGLNLQTSGPDPRPDPEAVL